MIGLIYLMCKLMFKATAYSMVLMFWGGWMMIWCMAALFSMGKSTKHWRLRPHRTLGLLLYW